MGFRSNTSIEVSNRAWNTNQINTKKIKRKRYLTVENWGQLFKDSPSQMFASHKTRKQDPKKELTTWQNLSPWDDNTTSKWEHTWRPRNRHPLSKTKQEISSLWSNRISNIFFERVYIHAIHVYFALVLEKFHLLVCYRAGEITINLVFLFCIVTDFVWP